MVRWRRLAGALVADPDPEPEPETDCCDWFELLVLVLVLLLLPLPLLLVLLLDNEWLLWRLFLFVADLLALLAAWWPKDRDNRALTGCW